MESTLLVLGNLLLDLVARVEDSYLESYNLTPDSIQTAKENHARIFSEILERKEVIFSPGGSALNTVRMAQKILNIPNVITFVGAVGSDETGKLLSETVEKEGIKMLVQYVAGNENTGRCACLLTNGGTARTMVTDLGAALKFSHETWLQSTANDELLGKVKFVYISGYFLKVSPATALEVARRAKQRNVSVLLNLNAVWVTSSCKQELQELLPSVNIIFGNEAEITSFGKEFGLHVGTTEEIISALSSLILEKRKTLVLTEEQELIPSRDVLILVTRGDLPVIFSENGHLKKYPVPTVSKEDLVDTTGAGDAFVGGFLASYVQKKSLDDCISCGIWAATEELKGYGFVLPSKVPQQFQFKN